MQIIIDQQEKISQEITQSLEYEEKNMFFVCPNGCRYNFEEASERNFICPECDCNMEFQDNSTIIHELKQLKDSK